MRRSMRLGLGIATTLTVTAAAATGASAALPEFTPAFPKAFHSTSTKEPFVATVSGGKELLCTADTSKGEVLGENTVVMTITYTGCIGIGANGTCQNAGPQEIITEKLYGTLGYVNLHPKEVGLDLMNPTGAPIAVFMCGSLPSELRGSVIGKVTPINKVVKGAGKLKLAFAEKAGHQHFKLLLGGVFDVPQLELVFPLEEAGLAENDGLTFGAPIEVIA